MRTISAPARIRRRLAAAVALSLLGLAAQPPAVAETPRQTYSDRFTTEVPGASTGRTYAIDYFNPAAPEGKPHAFSHLRVELADGARFDTSAIPQCRASDAELVASGPSACPPESKVGTDETLVDTGFSGPGRYFTVDFAFFNNKDELVLLATIRENGTRVVVRGRIGRNTLDIDNPMAPGTPPDGAAARRQRGQFEPGSTVREGKQANYLTTPPTCPDRGYWLNQVTWTYRDGVTQTAQSRSPCSPFGERSAERQGADRRRPVIRASGIPRRRCTKRGFRARFRISDDSALRSARVALGRRQLAESRRKRLAVRIRARRLRRGRHRIRVAAVDVHGNRGRRIFRFRRCRR